MKTTLSIITANVGSLVGTRAHPRLLEEAAKRLKEQEGDLLIDSFVTRCGGTLALVMTHARGADDDEARRLAHDVLLRCAEIATRMKLSGAGRDVLPGVAGMEFEERGSDPVLLFLADGAGAGTWNFHLYRAFADPFTTPGLVTDPSLREGFVFEVHDLVGHRKARFRTPEESYDLLACIGAPSRFAVGRVFTREGAVAAAASTGGSAGTAMIVRAESGFPAVGEVLDPFATPFLVAGGTRGAHHAPLMPVGVCDANATLFDGPPRAIGLGFQVSEGRLIGPADLFDDPGFDPARRRCLELAAMLRDHGPFEPRRLPSSGSAAPPAVDERPAERWEPLD